MTAVKYILFALIATAANLLAQFFAFSVYDGKFSLVIGMLFGTAAGLIIKYILDKKYIFQYEVKSKSDELQKFGLYSLVGVFTTSIFWVTEISFSIIFDNENAKYLGAIIGLAIGYITKYYLDKKFVFKDSNGAKNGAS